MQFYKRPPKTTLLIQVQTKSIAEFLSAKILTSRIVLLRMSQPEVLIVGAGPTGLVLALWLHKQGIKIRIIDQSEGINENSRALVVHARILELYRQLDLAEELVAAGYQLPASNIWVNGQHRVHLSLENYGKELTPYPYLLMVSQDRHEEILEKRLRSLGVSVERKTKLQSFVDNGSTVTATLLSEKYGTVTKCESAYIVGGAHGGTASTYYKVQFNRGHYLLLFSF